MKKTLWLLNLRGPKMTKDKFQHIKVDVEFMPILSKGEFYALSKATFEKMLRNQLQITINSSSENIRNKLRGQYTQWCVENCKSFVHVYNFVFYFEDPEDATGFKLKWAQNGT